MRGIAVVIRFLTMRDICWQSRILFGLLVAGFILEMAKMIVR